MQPWPRGWCLEHMKPTISTEKNLPTSSGAGFPASTAGNFHLTHLKPPSLVSTIARHPKRSRIDAVQLQPMRWNPHLWDSHDATPQRFSRFRPLWAETRLPPPWRWKGSCLKPWTSPCDAAWSLNLGRYWHHGLKHGLGLSGSSFHINEQHTHCGYLRNRWTESKNKFIFFRG